MSMTRKLTYSLIIVSNFLWASPNAALGQGLRQAATKTPMTRTELLVTLRDAHQETLGSVPTNKLLASAWSQVAFENGGGWLTYNHNLGNIGANGSDHRYYVIGTATRHRYRHFDSFKDAAAAYWSVIRRCEMAYQAFSDGNIKAATVSLKRCGYYEVDQATYEAALSQLYHTAIRQVIPDEERERHERERIEREWADYQLRMAFTPWCACSGADRQFSW